jgi:hypothetical protein
VTIRTGEEQTLGDRIIRYCFAVDYCSTCHSTRGSSIDDKIIMFDSKNKPDSWRWLGTAITRAKQLSYVYGYSYSNNNYARFDNTSLRS